VYFQVQPGKALVLRFVPGERRLIWVASAAVRMLHGSVSRAWVGSGAGTFGPSPDELLLGVAGGEGVGEPLLQAVSRHRAPSAALVSCTVREMRTGVPSSVLKRLGC
jgi:hypothetical protein